jgi:hypothetical protein
MSSRFTSCQPRTLLLVTILASGALVAADTKSSPPATQMASAPRGGSAKGPLPDPTLLDGAAHPAEKRPDYGMVGDFELPGDENARNGKVGGPQGQMPGGGGLPMPIPSAGGLPIPALPSGGVPGVSLPQMPDPLAKQGQGQGGGPENPAAAGKQAQGGQQGGQPQGAQVGQLSGEGGGPEQGQIGEKPPQVSLGDSAMQIKTVGNPASVVGGAQPAGQTQQHEKTPGSGGKGAQGNNGNKGVERGRAMPAGL